MLETIVKENIKEYEELSKIAGCMFNDLKELKAPYFNIKESENRGVLDENNSATSSQTVK